MHVPRKARSPHGRTFACLYREPRRAGLRSGFTGARASPSVPDRQADVAAPTAGLKREETAGARDRGGRSAPPRVRRTACGPGPAGAYDVAATGGTVRPVLWPGRFAGKSAASGDGGTTLGLRGGGRASQAGT
nr:hypothetical protein StreXyl84_71570 [Streptomyces sp. Xyl84]